MDGLTYYASTVINPLWPEFIFEKPGKMGPIVIYYHVNIMESDFELARQGLNEFVYPGHKGLRIIQMVEIDWT